MKSITTAIVLLSSVALLSAQTNPATPNASFNYWTHSTSGGGYDDPNDWNCLNPETSLAGKITCYKDSTGALSGDKYAVELLTQSLPIVGAVPGTITTGTIDAATETINGGLPYTLRPDSITGWYKYTSVSGDNGEIEFYLFGTNHTDTVGEAFLSTPTSNVSSWTRFSYPITYRSSDVVDTALWIFTSSINQAGAQVGSQLYIDSIGLVFNPTGISNMVTSENITVWPNPATNFVSINNNSNSKSLLFTLVDVTGRKVEEERITVGTSYMNVTGVTEGIYIYSIRDEQNAIVKTGKIIVQN